MEEYVTLGHTRLVTEDELRKTPPGQSNFIPHHGVVNPNKPEKVRPVFDASFRFNGVSLNDRLLKGTDLLTNLVGVLLRFRQHVHAVSADKEKMFYQVRVSRQARLSLLLEITRFD